MLLLLLKPEGSSAAEFTSAAAFICLVLRQQGEMAAASRQSYLQSNEGPGHTLPIYLQERTTKDRREKIINHANRKECVIIHQHSVFFLFRIIINTTCIILCAEHFIKSFVVWS